MVTFVSGFINCSNPDSATLMDVAGKLASDNIAANLIIIIKITLTT